MVRGAWFHPSGFTLLEVIVVMVILGLIVGMSGLAFVSLRAPREADRMRDLRHAREEAIRAGRPVAVGGNQTPRTTLTLFLPDGRGIGSAVDPLTGAPIDAAR